MLHRSGLAVALRFLWECLNSRTVNWFPVLAASNPACGFPALGFPGSSYQELCGLLNWDRFLSGSVPSQTIVVEDIRACRGSTAYSTASSLNPRRPGAHHVPPNLPLHPALTIEKQRLECRPK